ncbi:MAG: carbohydrate ABC transporter permease [bacterium]
MTNTTSLTSTRNVDFLNNQVNYSNLSSMIEQEENRKKKVNIISKVIIYTFLAIMAIVVLFPFYWMINTALKSLDEIDQAVQTFVPNNWMWSNFVDAMNVGSFTAQLTNTVIVGVAGTIGTVIITILSAFAFARLEFKGKNAIFGVLLATMMIPGEMLVITNFITVANVFQLQDTLLALIIPFMVSVFYIFLLRQNFKQIPNELYYAAKVDGTSDFKYLRRVMIPLAKSTIITISILNLMGAWNSYVWPSLVNTTADKRLISNWLRTAFSGQIGTETRTSYNLQMAAALIITAPLLLVYIFLRKYIMQSVSRSGIKG